MHFLDAAPDRVDHLLAIGDRVDLPVDRVGELPQLGHAAFHPRQRAFGFFEL